ncbi:MAG: hypothetical protein FJ357_07925 [Thaumarchaeota archaeon]|nr:hypothetical protein [Nitrososphaerota archaeon]
MKISIVTACGNKKEQTAMPAWQLYKSPRIKAVHKRKGSHDMYILSAEHGMIPSEKVISPYNRMLDEKRLSELLPQVKNTIKNYDAIVYFKAGARKLYEECLRRACIECGVNMISFGFGFMGGINEMDKKVREAEAQMTINKGENSQ